MNEGVVVQDYAVAPGAPQGLQNIAPGGMGTLFLPVPDPTCPDITAQLTHQIVANAETNFGETVPVEIVALNLQAVGPNLVQVAMQGRVMTQSPSSRGVPFPGITKLKVSNDFRTFFQGGGVMVSLCTTDFDMDGDVDLGDFGIFGAAFGSVAGDANYNPAADFDNDGDVDLGDFGVFGSDFGRSDC